MSTKTTLKRIALVAVSALGFGLLSIAPSQANNWSSTTDFLDCQTAYADTAGIATGCVGVAGGRVTIDNYAVTLYSSYGMVSNTDHYIEVTGGSIVEVGNDGTNDTDMDFLYGSSAAANATTGVTWPRSSITNTGADADGLILVDNNNAAVDAGDEYFTVTRADAGTTTITVFYFDASGTRNTVETQYITWIATADSGISATESKMYVVSAGGSGGEAQCDASTESQNTTTAAFGATMSAYAKSKMSSADTDGGVIGVCLSFRDGAGRALDDVDVELSISKGNVAADDGSPTASRVENTKNYNEFYEIGGDPDETGVATITAKLTDKWDNEVTITGTASFWGDVTSVVLTNNTYAASVTSTTAADYTDDDAIYITAKDANGIQIDLDEEAFGLTTGDGSDLLVDSSIGTVATNADAKGEEDAAATVTVYSADSATAGVADGEIKVVCLSSVTGAYAEKLSIKLYLTNRAGTAYVISNAVDFYCSKGADTVSVTAAQSTVAASGTTTIQVSVKDSNGFPVMDGTSVSLVTTNGGSVAPATKSTVNGAFFTPATFVASSDNAKVTVTAVVGSKTGATTITVGTGVSSATASADAAADAAAEAIDAANAATDAANLAAEAADAATVAAEEARDAADAATAAVEKLASDVATLMASLKAQITTLANTVAKIAKKVKA